MVTTIGIDPHKATHTAVAIDESEIVLAEITIDADRHQMSRLLGWADNVNGHSSRVWAVKAAGGLGYLLSQQLVARGEHVVDVPAVLASRVRVLSSGRSDKNDPNDARSVAIAALRQPLGGGAPRGPCPGAAHVGETTPRTHRSQNPSCVSPPCSHDAAPAGWNGSAPVSIKGNTDAARDAQPRGGW